MTSAIVFDDGKGDLGPMTDLRPVFNVRTGALTTLERLSLVLAAEADVAVVGVLVPKALAGIARESVKAPVNDEAMLGGEEADFLFVNGRCPVPPEEVAKLEAGEALVAPGGNVVAARFAPSRAQEFLKSLTLPAGTKVAEAKMCLLEQPWDVIRFRDEALEFDLQSLLANPTQELPAGVVAINDEAIRISPDALVYPNVVLDAEQGAIVIADHATIRPGAVIIGPAYVGPGSTVIDRALIKGHTAIGPVCKVGGEVGGTIFQGFANKAHDGHLGDSWVGEWVNFGAGTTNSNLLNTYGEVVAQPAPDGPLKRTGLQFLGCIVGDHVKFAIMTRIMTGSVFGTGSMIAAATPSAAVGRFEWITDDRRQPYRFEKFIEVARAAMGRRRVTPSEGYVARLREIASDGA